MFSFDSVAKKNKVIMNLIHYLILMVCYHSPREKNRRDNAQAPSLFEAIYRVRRIN